MITDSQINSKPYIFFEPFHAWDFAQPYSTFPTSLAFHSLQSIVYY